ncbi:lipocalin-like domain-containing protein [Niastella caeni]|uniref:Lipocalin-like domain-containing protein n=1 Tax=Niastella caeni TaxID=2569763 RepID=A0A4S8HS49_9BACT|nr:lipocalin-like domain-containing protein [Niastella caeni]THU38293.1 lipocalin-like domain-containing protein [Niastella caeni]
MKKIISLLLVLGSVSILYAQKDQPSKRSLQQQLIGTWTLLSVDNIYADGSRVHPYGENPQGLLIFDEKGNYAIQILKAVRPKIASGDKNKCTPEESAALVQGSNSHFGKYEVDEKGSSITFNIEHAFYPNWEGTRQKRIYTYTGDEIKYVVTHTTQGGQEVIAEVAWRRLK